MLLKPNDVLSIFDQHSIYKEYYPLLYWIFNSHNQKLCAIFVDCLFHFGEIILSQNLKNFSSDSTTSNKVFLKEYLNFNKMEGEHLMGSASFVKFIRIFDAKHFSNFKFAIYPISLIPQTYLQSACVLIVFNCF